MMKVYLNEINIFLVRHERRLNLVRVWCIRIKIQNEVRYYVRINEVRKSYSQKWNYVCYLYTLQPLA